MEYKYDKNKQLLYAAVAGVILLFGLTLVYFGYSSLNSISAVPGANMGRSMNRMAGRGIIFIIMMMVAGLYIALYSRKPLKWLLDSMKSKVVLSNDGVAFTKAGVTEYCDWKDIKKVANDDFTGLEIKYGSQIMVIAKRYENWEHLVQNVTQNVPKKEDKER